MLVGAYKNKPKLKCVLWCSKGANGDQVDGGRGIQGLLNRLQSDIGHVSLLGGCELELLSDMDPESLTDIVPDRYVSFTKIPPGIYLCPLRW